MKQLASLFERWIMANQLGSNPWVIDTPGAGLLFQTDIDACHFEWEGYAAGTDTVEVQDRYGKKIWGATAKSDLSLVESYTIAWVHGLKVTTMTSGILRVYFG